jgi:signal transduction histidine kinase
LQASHSDDNQAHVKVIDSGIGMPDRIKDNLFTIDGKVGRKGTEGEPTAGLGLILVKEFVDKHKGSILISSTEHEGTEIEIVLPY